jgi:triosephosphate isomerase
MRTPLIAGNWKMYKTIAEAVATADTLAALVEGVEDCEVLVAPVFTAIPAVADRLRGTAIFVAAQDVAAEPGQGAFTGEVSAEQLVDAGATHCIVGHSERRLYFGEIDASVNRKLRAALAAGLQPIACVGETLEERDADRAEAVVERQLRGAFEGLTASDLSRTITAYEPVWAIGTGRTATPETAQNMHHFLRGMIAEIAGAEVADRMRILYGGSAKPENVAELLRQPDIDGALVGGASLDAMIFATIVRITLDQKGRPRRQ